MYFDVTQCALMVYQIYKGDYAMKYRVFYITLCFCVALVLMINTVEAQNQRSGSSAAPELLIPVGARDLALGGSSLANSSGVESIHWNPAGLGRISYDAEGMFSSMSYIADIGVSYGAVASKFGNFGVVGLSVKSLSFGDIPLTTDADPDGDGGRFFSPTYFVLGFSYGRLLTDAISAGGTFKVISESIDRVSATGIAIDVGVQYHRIAGVDGLQLGVAVKNIGPQMKFDGSGLYHVATVIDGRRPEQNFKSDAASFELPSLVEIGFSYTKKVENNMMWSLNSSFTNNNLYLDEYRLGGEVGYFFKDVQLFGRGGYAFLPQADDDAQIYGVTLGVGVGYKAEGVNITVDYAYRQVDFFDSNNIISLKLGF